MDATSDEKSPAKRPHAERDLPNGVNHEESESPPNLEDRSTALSNYVILKNIFKFLSPDDLESCSYVSKFWREFANPLVVHHYGVEIQVGWVTESPDPIVVLTRERTNFIRQKKSALSFENAMETLEKISRTQKVVLNFVLEFAICFGDNDILLKKFLAKFGPLVEHLGFFRTRIVPAGEHLIMLFNLLESMPNLKSINCASLMFLEMFGFNMVLPPIEHGKLKKISFDVHPVSSSETLVKFLKVAPNLGEIHKLPILRIDSVGMAEKGQILKSLTYDHPDLEGFFAYDLLLAEAFEKLAALQPKLSSFFFPGTSSGRRIIEMIQPSVWSILQSSAQSLQTFEIGTWDGLEIVPQLKGVETLVFQASLIQESCHLPGITLGEKFPNANAISILFDYLYDDRINEYLPKNIESSWGSRIKRLHVKRLSACSLPLLQEMFPLVEDLQFSGSATQIADHLPEIAKLWPRIKSMTIRVGNSWTFVDEFLLPGPGNLNCSFTGFSLDRVAQLLDPLIRESLPDDQIQDFKSESTISKLRELQRLTLRLDNYAESNNEGWEEESMKVYTTLTDVANEFGFKLIPNLKVFVGIWDLTRNFREIEAALEPLASSSNVEILYFNPNENGEE